MSTVKLPRGVLALVGVLVLSTSLYAALSDAYVLDCDVINLALGITRFDPREHQPHPPGYLAYVLLLRVVHALTPLGPVDVALWVSRAFSLLTIALSFLAARRLLPEPGEAGWVAALVASNPIVLYYGVDGQTHAAEGAMSAALLAALPRPGEAPSWSRTIAIGGLLAAGGSMRPTYALIAVLPVLWSVGLRPARLAAIGAVAGGLTLAWLVPTVALSGGLAEYRAASDALVGNLVRMVSPLGGNTDERYAALNLRDTLAWSLLALAPALFAILASLRADWSTAARRLTAMLALMALPAIAFFALVLCAEAGYLEGLVPIAALAAAALLTERRRLLLPALAAAQLAFFFFGPLRAARTFMLPDAAEIFERQIFMRTLDERIHEGLPADARVLVVTDFFDGQMRQLSVLHPETDILYLGDKARFALGDLTSVSLATAQSWRGVPGRALNAPGPLRTLETATRYDWLVLDPRASDRLVQALRAQLSCPVPATDSEMHSARLLVEPCLPSRTLRWGQEGYRFTFGANDRAY